MAYNITNIIDADFETTSKVDLTEVGAHRYSRDLSTVCYQAWFKFDDIEVEWRLGWPMPVAVFDAIKRGYHIAAHNREFEACIWNNLMVPKHGWPAIPIDSGICTAAVAASNGLPRDLATVAMVRGYSVQKDMAGNRIMKQIMKGYNEPMARGVTILSGGKGSDPVHKFKKGDNIWQMPEMMDRISSYCRDDIRGESMILKDPYVYPLNPFEYRLWQNDCRINWRGAYVDQVSLQGVIETYELMVQYFTNQMVYKTSGRVQAAGADTVLEEAKRYGITMDGNTKESRADLLARDDLEPEFRQFLNLVNSLKKTSCSKLYRMRSGVCADGRIRGLMVFCGAARTGRWASRLLQLQNMTGNADLNDAVYEVILQFCRARDYKGLIRIFGWGAMDALSWCIRPLICAAPGKEMVDADFSAIEARVIAWLAGEQWRLEFFRYTPATWPEGRELYQKQLAAGEITANQWPILDGAPWKPDVYIKSYSETFKVPYQQVTKKQRKVGKIEELALGFGGGIGSMKAFGADKLGMSDSEITGIVQGWRKANPFIKDFWYKMEAAAINAIKCPGMEFDVNGKVQLFTHGPYLHIRLPSGRLLHYYGPSVRYEYEPRWDKYVDKIYYWGRKSDEGSDEGAKWTEISTYSGKLAENVTQAIARDLIAESLLRAEKAGYETIFHVHDEMVNEQDEGTTNLKEFTDLMSVLPAWAGDMPVAASGWIGKRFKKD